MARVERTVGEGRSIKASDPHDAQHCAVGAYVDVLVTSDVEFTNTLAMIPDLPFEVLGPTDLAQRLHTSLQGSSSPTE